MSVSPNNKSLPDGLDMLQATSVGPFSKWSLMVWPVLAKVH